MHDDSDLPADLRAVLYDYSMFFLFLVWIQKCAVGGGGNHYFEDHGDKYGNKTSSSWHWSFLNWYTSLKKVQKKRVMHITGNSAYKEVRYSNENAVRPEDRKPRLLPLRVTAQTYPTRS